METFVAALAQFIAQCDVYAARIAELDRRGARQGEDALVGSNRFRHARCAEENFAARNLRKSDNAQSLAIL